MERRDLWDRAVIALLLVFSAISCYLLARGL